jgi:hypothetical protein
MKRETTKNRKVRFFLNCQRAKPDRDMQRKCERQDVLQILSVDGNASSIFF